MNKKLPLKLNTAMHKEFLKYLLHQLYLIDPAMMRRYDLLNARNKMYIKMFQKEKELSADELFTYKKDAMAYILHKSSDIKSVIAEMVPHDAMVIMNSKVETMNFLENFKSTEEELKNDIFF